MRCVRHLRKVDEIGRRARHPVEEELDLDIAHAGGHGRDRVGGKRRDEHGEHGERERDGAKKNTWPFHSESSVRSQGGPVNAPLGLRRPRVQ